MQFRVVHIQFNFDGDQMRIRFGTYSSVNKHLQGNDRNELECGVVLQCDSITETLPRVHIPSVGTVSPYYTLHQMTLASVIRIPRVVKVTFN